MIRRMSEIDQQIVIYPQFVVNSVQTVDIKLFYRTTVLWRNVPCFDGHAVCIFRKVQWEASTLKAGASYPTASLLAVYQTAASLSKYRVGGFDPRPIHVEFVPDRVTSGQIFVLSTSVVLSVSFHQYFSCIISIITSVLQLCCQYHFISNSVVLSV
jgi:hypothetical protein